MNKALKIIACCLLLLFCTLPVFAQVMPSGMTSLAESIKEIFTGAFMRVIFGLFLCGSAVAYAFNKDNEKVKRNCIAIIIGAAICIGASGIMEMVWAASQG
jgi:glycerol uptake facilitator-like aquaporin